MMNSQELKTAVRMKLHIVVVVLNDSGYGMIKWKQGTGGFPAYGLDYTNPNFVGYANSYGAVGHRLERTEDLPSLLQTCLTQPAVHLIDLPISYTSSDQELNVELKPIVAALRAERASWKPPAAASPRKQSGVSKALGSVKSLIGGKPKQGAPDFGGDGPLATDPLVGGAIKKVWPIFVGDEAAVTSNLLPVTDKFTNEVICEVSLGAASDVDRAIVLAEAALPAMQKLPAFTRKKILLHCVEQARHSPTPPPPHSQFWPHMPPS